MNVLNEYQIELIHREIDGENSPEASAEVRELVATQPEALALMTSLQSLDALFGEVPDREPSPGARQAISSAMSLNPRVSEGTRYVQGTQTITGWAAQQWNGVSNFMGELMSTKKILIGATTAMATIAIIGYALVGSQPSVFDAGTIGSGDGMGGVEKAGRYQGAKKTEDDVTLSHPEIQALLQNDKVLRLVKSDVFREVMKDDAFHELMSSEVFQQLMSNEAFHELMSNEALHDLMSSDAFHELMSNEAYHELMSNEALHDVMSTEAYRDLASNEAFHELMSNEAFSQLMSNEAYRDLLSNEAYFQLMSNDAFHELMSNEAFSQLMSNEAYFQLMSNEAFRELSRDQAQSQAFFNEAMRADM